MKESKDTPPAEASPVEKWAAEEIQSIQPPTVPKGVDEKAVAEKVKAGLTRKQALEVLEAQSKHDATLSKKK